MGILFDYSYHKENTKKSSKIQRKVKFEEFKEAFEKQYWDVERNYLFLNYATDSEVFCESHKFNGVGFISKNIYQYYLISKYLKEIKNYKTLPLIKDISSKLVQKLEEICKKENIKLSYVDELDDAAGKIYESKTIQIVKNS